jgi:hypothetical protein
MSDTTDGMVEALFCVLLADDRYEAHRGRAEFREGKLVGLRIGRVVPGRQDAVGLTVGFTILAAFTAEPSGPGQFARGHAFTRVYVGGVLDSETDLGDVDVSTDRL